MSSGKMLGTTGAGSRARVRELVARATIQSKRRPYSSLLSASRTSAAFSGGKWRSTSAASPRTSSRKTGMLLNVEIVEAVAAFIAEAKIPAVVDPVMVASSGATLLSAEAVSAVRRQLLPLAAVVTPNLDEASILLGRKALGGKHGPAEALELAKRFGVPFLVKGGHAEGDTLVDALAWPDGRTLMLTAQRIPGIDTHGSGCTLSAAITAQLARGETLAQAVQLAHTYLQNGMKNSMQVVGLKHIRH